MPAYYQAHASILSRVNNGGEYLNYYYAVSKMNQIHVQLLSNKVLNHIFNMWFLLFSLDIDY